LALLESSSDSVYTERRGRRRVRLRWPVSILKGEREVLSGVTENLSSRGFSCVVEKPLAEGETVVCILRWTAGQAFGICEALRCDGYVVWVRAMADGRYCVGCRIDDYKVV
jgi:hypothetical protein